MPIINVKNLSAYYENRKVFENVNFTVSEGDYLCIIGENGSGKTTLMKTLLGMNIKHTGTVEFNGFKKKEIGWQLAIVDAGIREIGPDGKKRVILLPSTDSNIDVAVTSPALLDGHGKALVINPNSEKPAKPYCGLFYGYIPTRFEKWVTSVQE